MKKKYEEVKIKFYQLLNDVVMLSDGEPDNPFEEYDNIGYLD